MKNLGVILVLMMIWGSTYAQKPQIQNLPDFDERRFHFGFALGYNKANYQIDHSAEYFNSVDSLVAVSVEPQPGFNLGIVSSLKVTPNIRLRFIPTLSFQERSVNYSYFDSSLDTISISKQKAEATYLEFPLYFKFRTNRVNNFAAYFLAGGKFGLDMQNKVDVANTIVLKTKKQDYSIEVGGGTDFFLEYFKLGFELKLGLGIPNALIQENNYLSSPIESLKTRTWMFSITFEG